MATETLTAAQTSISPAVTFRKHPDPAARPLPKWLIEEAHVSNKEAFDANKHINFVPPERIYTMEELGIAGQGISNTAVSAPFTLFTPEAVRQIRGEIFSDEVLDTCQASSKFSPNLIRGHCPDKAPFVTDAWYDPKVLEVVSGIAGVDLVPVIPYDVGHINISITDDAEQPVEMSGPLNMKDLSATGWHFDCYPFVCVTMLSDCTGMIGGETVIRTPSGDLVKVRGHAMGTAVVMQGLYLEHQALKACNVRERISMVTSFRPKSSQIRDDTHLGGVRGISYVPDLYFQYTRYRLVQLEERMREQRKKLLRHQDIKLDFDVQDTKNFLIEQKRYMDALLDDLIECY